MRISIEEADKQDYKKIKKLYKTAFPREERAPFFIIRNRAKHKRAQMLAVKDDNIFVGFAYLVCYLDMVYLFFLAIDAQKRGSGYGSRILKELQRKYEGRRIFLAREELDKKADNYEQRLKRHEFYLKNGFEDLPCKIQEANVVYDVMGVGGKISSKEYEALISGWAGKWIKKLICMRILESDNP